MLFRSSLPKRAHPARQAHQPLGPGTASRPQAVSPSASGFRRSGGVDASLSAQRSQHPFKLPPDARPTSRVSTLTARMPSRPATASARQQLRFKGQPNPRSRKSQRPAQTRNQSSHTRQSQTPQPTGPRIDTLGSLSHLVGVHPPCSRKGPLLPACGLKCPRRVKRETTNSRFFVSRGLGQNFMVDSRQNQNFTSPGSRPPPSSRFWVLPLSAHSPTVPIRTLVILWLAAPDAYSSPLAAELRCRRLAAPDRTGSTCWATAESPSFPAAFSPPSAEELRPRTLPRALPCRKSFCRTVTGALDSPHRPPRGLGVPLRTLADSPALCRRVAPPAPSLRGLAETPALTFVGEKARGAGGRRALPAPALVSSAKAAKKKPQHPGFPCGPPPRY